MENSNRSIWWLLTWQGRISRIEYAATAALLAGVKFLTDVSIAARFGESWSPLNYLMPWLHSFEATPGHDRMMRMLGLLALPFLWCGVALTVRRLRDAGMNVAMALLFFIPIVNWALFFSLCAAPTRRWQQVPAMEEDGQPEQGQDYDGVLGITFASVFGFVLTDLATRVLLTYAWGLFLGVPFFTGFVCGLIQNARTLRTRKATMRLSAIPPFLIGIALLLSGYEGAICLVMAAPLALPVSMLGALLAYEIQERRRFERKARLVGAAGVLPLLLVAEYLSNPQPPVHPVTTSIVINAPVERVWKNVITFPQLAPPTEAIFHTGIAYPTSATIVGTGPGAVRYCHFTTGDFVEPITTWDTNHLLAFSVAKQPEAMRELSPWKIVPAHIEHNYFRSQHGQFRLQPIDASHTLLEGTTWYQDYFWPQQYWNVISDQIVHRIHLRVLKHVKQQAEMGLSHRGDLD